MQNEVIYIIYYFLFGFIISTIFTIIMVLCEAYHDSLQPVIFGAFIFCAWPVFLALCVIFGIPYLVYTGVCSAVEAWRRQRVK